MNLTGRKDEWHSSFDFDLFMRDITTSAGDHEDIEVERRVDTVIIRQGDNEIQLDEWYVKGLRDALFTLAPREVGP